LDIEAMGKINPTALGKLFFLIVIWDVSPNLCSFRKLDV
jgi:hypothetical protein